MVAERTLLFQADRLITGTRNVFSPEALFCLDSSATRLVNGQGCNQYVL
jgi:hypothetical protein